MRVRVPPWWQGTFPTWIVVILLSIIGSFARSIVTDNESFHQRLALIVEANGNRVTKLEERLNHLTASQDRIEREIKDINTWLRENL